jgi:hypothetical protein
MSKDTYCQYRCTRIVKFRAHAIGQFTAGAVDRCASRCEQAALACLAAL